MLGSKCCCKTPCDSTTASGGAGITEKIISMPLYSGFVTFTYNAFLVPDKFTVYGIYEGEEFVLFDTIVQVSGSETIQIFKPFGVTQVKVRVEGPPGTAWTYYISCPERDDNGKYCGPDTFGEVVDEKTGAISTPLGGSYLSEDECAAVRTPDTVAELPQPTNNRSIENTPAPIPTTGPNGGGYFPRSVQYGFGKLPCGAQTHTNITQPPWYNLRVNGTYISNDPDVYLYYISDQYPTKSGRIIFNCRSGLSQNPIDTPTRKVSIWGFTDFISNRSILLREFTIEPNNAITNWCSTLEKPAGIQYIVVVIAEDNPANARAIFSLNFSGLVTSDDNLFQVQSDDNVYQSRIVNLGDTGGIVDFYASVYMSDDVFFACVDVDDPNSLPDPFKDLPRAKFRISDENNVVLKEFTLDARFELENVPPTATKLTAQNTFVDILETLYKEAESQELRIETWYSRNTVFRWTIGCPRASCFSLCNLTGTPNQIVVELEGEDYFFEYENLGADVYRDKGYNAASGGSGPIPLAAGLTFGAGGTINTEYISKPIGTPRKFLPGGGDPDRWEFVDRYSYNAIWGVPASKYNRTVILSRQDDGDYKFVFEEPETCPDYTDNPTEIILKTGASYQCGLWMNNFKAFWRWKLNHNNVVQYNCDTAWDWANFAFSGFSCMNHSFSVSCDMLKTGNLGLERNVLHFLRGYSSFIKIESAYEYSMAKYNWMLFNQIFLTDTCFDVPADKCGWYTTNKIPFAGIDALYLGRVAKMRECYLSPDEYSPIFQFPYTDTTIPRLDRLKSFSREKGKPYITVKSVKAVS